MGWKCRDLKCVWLISSRCWSKLYKLRMLLVRLKNELSRHLYLCQHYLQLTIDIVDIIIDRIMNELVLQFSIDLSLPETSP